MGEAKKLRRDLDRSMAGNGCDYEDLFVRAQPGQVGQLERAFDGDVFVGQSNPDHHTRLPLRDLCQLLPI